MTEFEQIYRTYFNDVYLYIRRLSNNDHIAEEITSDTFFKAMRTIDSFRGECDVRVWLCQIAKNCYYDYLKRFKRIESLDDNELLNLAISYEELPEELIANRDETARIQRILHSVPEPYKEVFMWRVFGNLSFKQIARIFGKTENWACVTYHRAKKMIKDKLEG